MAAVNNTTSTGNLAETYAKLNGNTASKTSSTTEDMENRFLTLLTTQLKNQDPLNPLDNAQVTSQLAQINTVNGIEKLNATMAQLMAAYDNSQAIQQAGMVGRSVLVAGSAMTLYQGQSLAGVNLEGDADKVTVTIKDASGKVVQSQDLGSHMAGNFSFIWDGKSDTGEQLKDGNYTFSVEAASGNDKVKASALQLGTVSAVTRSGKEFILDLGSRGSVKFADVQQIL